MKRYKHNLSHYRDTGMNCGDLTPIMVKEVLPSDSFQVRISALVRMQPLLNPVMHPYKVRIQVWYVPLRLIWEDFEEFITGGQDGTSTPTHPFTALDVVGVGGLPDCLGIPPNSTGYNYQHFSVLPARAYNLIWNEFYRDKDLETEAPISLASGSDPTTTYVMKSPTWDKDYFTTCRPWESRGDDVRVPITGTGYFRLAEGSISGTERQINTDGGNNLYAVSGAGSQTLYWPEDTDFADIDFSDIRAAAAVQRFQERHNKSGADYADYLRLLGVNPHDSRLRKPEFLGGGRQTVQFSEILGTGSTSHGLLKGHGIAAIRTRRIRRFFPEHGLVLALMCVTPKTMYDQALDKMFMRETKEDYFQPEFVNVGDQIVKNREIHATHATPEGTFGYQTRYDEYRSHFSSVHQEMREGENYEDWHAARFFATDPTLNASFVSCAPTDRIFQSITSDHMQVMVHNQVIARRPVPHRA